MSFFSIKNMFQKKTSIALHNSPWGNSGGSNGDEGDRPNSNSPWGNNSGGGGNRKKPDQDLEEFLKKGREQFSNMLPPGGVFSIGGGVLGAIVVIIWGLTGIYFVEPNQRGVVLRFGEFSTVTVPGANYHLPYPIEEVRIVDTTDIRELTIGGNATANANVMDANYYNSYTPMPELSNGLMLTGDENIVDVKFTASWFINDPKAYLFNVENPEVTVSAVADSAMREVVGRSTLESILMKGKTKIEEEALTLTQKMLDDYGAGIKMTRVQLKSTDTPQEVIESFRGVQQARADREKVINQAQGFQAEQLNKAKGDASKMFEEAKAYKVTVVEGAKGEANRFEKVVDAYSDAKDVTRKRLYIETMEKVLEGKNKIIMENKNGVVPYLPLNELNKKSNISQ